MKLSVLVPVYNEESTVPEVVRRVRAVAAPGLSIEIRVVDDASTDGTWGVLERLMKAGEAGAAPSDLEIARHQVNQGKGSAIRTALSTATGDVVIIQDGDLEYDPSDYRAILEAMDRLDAQVVYGSRILGRNPHSYLRYYYGGRLLTAIFNILYGTRLTDLTTCYKAFRRGTILSLPLASRRFEFCPEVTARLARRGIPIHEVPVSYHPRSLASGKKIRWHDGLAALWTMLKLRWQRSV